MYIGDLSFQNKKKSGGNFVIKNRYKVLILSFGNTSG